MKKKITTILIIIATLILAGVAVFTAIRLFQTRTSPVAPNVPSSEPEAAFTQNTSCTALTFSISTPTSTPTETPTITPSPVPECNSVCTTDDDCPTALFCYILGGEESGYCRVETCSTKADCMCPTATPTATPTTTPTTTSTSIATPTPTGTSTVTITNPPVAQTTGEPALPEAGTSWPTIIGSILGTLLVVGSIVLLF